MYDDDHGFQIGERVYTASELMNHVLYEEIRAFSNKKKENRKVSPTKFYKTKIREKGCAHL